MYIEIEMSLSEDGDIKLVLDTDKGPDGISLSLITKDGDVLVENIEMHKLGQFVLNVRRLLTMAHEDSVLSSDTLDDDDDDDDDD